MNKLPRKRVLLITRNLPPLVGGMERLNWHMAEELAQRVDVRVIGPQGSAPLAPRGVFVHEVSLRSLARFLVGAQLAALREASKWRPDVVLAGSGLTALPALVAARASGARAAAYVHGLDLAVQHPVYRHLWLPALRRLDRVVANSEASRTLALAAQIEKERLEVVHPGVLLPSLPFTPSEEPEFRKEYKLSGRSVLLSVGRLSERKGILEFVRNALPLIVEQKPDAVLAIVGDTPSEALHAKAQSLQAILRAAEQAGLANNVRFIGQITDYEKLGAAYRGADVHVFPVRDIPGDPEGFGMVAVEAAAHGLPTVAFATGGVLDAVADNVSGRLISPGDYQGMAAAVLDVLTRPKATWAGCRAHAERFAWPAFGQQLVASLDL